MHQANAVKDHQLSGANQTTLIKKNDCLLLFIFYSILQLSPSSLSDLLKNRIWTIQAFPIQPSMLFLKWISSTAFNFNNAGNHNAMKKANWGRLCVFMLLK